MALAKYQVERRPITDSGTVLRGLQNGDYVLTLTDPKAITDPTVQTSLSKPIPSSPTQAASYFIPAGKQPTGIAATQQPMSHVKEIPGEPWLVHSTHSSIESALDSAAPLASAIGSDNVRIVQVLSHKMNFKLN